MPSGTQLYMDGSGSVTTVPIGTPTPTNALPSGTQLYKDGSGNVTTLSGTPPNTPIPSTTKFYVNAGQVKTSLISTGDPMYEDKNGKIITDITTSNTKLTAKDKVYIDDAGNLTMSPTTANEKLNMGDIRNLKSELKDPSTTISRAKEINKILDDPDVAPLMQLDSDLNAEISQGVTVDYNKTAADVLEFTDKTLGAIDTKSVISDIVSNLSIASDTTKTTAEQQTALDNINNKNLKELDAIISNLLQTRSSVGTLQNRMDSAKTTNEDQNYNMTSILSSTGDIDLTEKTVEYSSIQTVYTAALQTSAKILKNTILDYI
jgi:flagellar hook-associated protein 3 FlgL